MTTAIRIENTDTVAGVSVSIIVPGQDEPTVMELSPGQATELVLYDGDSVTIEAFQTV